MRRYLPLAAIAVFAVAAWSVAYHPWGWLYALGVHPYPGPQTPWTYQLWSGFTPALTVLTLLGSVFSLYHLHNCHEPGCLRLGKLKAGGSPWCKLHVHKAKPHATSEEILQQILEELRRQ